MFENENNYNAENINEENKEREMERFLEEEINLEEENNIEGKGDSNTRNKRKREKAFAICLTAASVFGSAAFGFIGGSIANKSNTTNKNIEGNTVMYQSVVNTSLTGENGETKELSIKDVAKTVKESVVEITTEIVTTNGRMGQMVSEGAGSGVIVSKDGYIVTNNHVIDGANSITVRLSDSTEYTATLIGKDSKTDIAVIKIDETDLQSAILGNSSTLVVGEEAVAIGNPLGQLGGTVTQGIISALDREITIDGETMSLLQTDTAINAGNSGGGLFNLYGELVGIVNAKSSGSEIEGLGFAIPIDTAKKIIQDIIENGYATGRIDTGLTLVDIQDTQAAMTYRVNKIGLYILKSENSDFVAGDIITNINGKEVSDIASYNQIMQEYKVGDTIEITVNRNEKSYSYSIKLEELKS